MRWPHAILLVTALCFGACNIVQPAAGGAAGTAAGGSDAGVNCSTAGTCDDCRSCAVSGPCMGVFETCQLDSACAAIDQCVALGDTEADCEAQNPSGVSDWMAAAQCVFCTQCPNQCPGLCG